jgi:hypothetical protein
MLSPYPRFVRWPPGYYFVERRAENAKPLPPAIGLAQKIRELYLTVISALKSGLEKGQLFSAQSEALLRHGPFRIDTPLGSEVIIRGQMMNDLCE